MRNLCKLTLVAAAIAAVTSAQAASDLEVQGSNQDVSGGTVAASRIVADANGWLVVHRTDAAMKPGPVVGHAPVRAGSTDDVVAILTEPVASGEMLMLMLHAEAGGSKTGIFEYTLGAKIGRASCRERV